jgi:ketosteroid isomerase-like protein
MESLTLDSFDKWMGLYRKASEDSDLEAAADLFSQDAEYYETPFSDPVIGREAIYRYWSEAAQAQKDIHFSFEILDVKGNLGIALWKGEFVSVKADSHVLLDGVFLVEFDGQGQCKKFREWWHRRVIEPSTGDV